MEKSNLSYGVEASTTATIAALVVIGCGSIGRAFLSTYVDLEETHEHLHSVDVVTARPEEQVYFDQALARLPQTVSHSWTEIALTPENYRAVLAPLLARRRAAIADSTKIGVVLNVSVEVCSTDVARLAAEYDFCYVDTCNEPWPGGYVHGSMYERSNAKLRADFMRAAEKARMQSSSSTLLPSPTAITCCGANPGWISHVVRDALLDVARAWHSDQYGAVHLVDTDTWTRQRWQHLAESIGLREIHIAEVDTQELTSDARAKYTELLQQTTKGRALVNTWSPPGFASEALEQHCEYYAAIVDGEMRTASPCVRPSTSSSGVVPYEGDDARGLCFHTAPGYMRACSFTPAAGRFHGYVIPHNECQSLAAFFASERYQPGVAYIYRPCFWARRYLEARETARTFFAECGAAGLPSRVPTNDELVASGYDELGCLLVFANGVSYWKGSHLTNSQVSEAGWRHQNPTGAQVVGGILGALAFIRRRPRAGWCEAEDIPASIGLAAARPYLGTYYGRYTNTML